MALLLVAGLIRGMRCNDPADRGHSRKRLHWRGHLADNVEPTRRLINMRLTDSEQAAIAKAASAALPAGSRVLLFGSRTDDSRRGGDIDLLVEPPEPVDAAQVVALRTRLAAGLYRMMGERRIDILVAAANEFDTRLVVVQAREHGIELVRT